MVGWVLIIFVDLLGDFLFAFRTSPLRYFTLVIKRHLSSNTQHWVDMYPSLPPPPDYGHRSPPSPKQYISSPSKCHKISNPALIPENATICPPSIIFASPKYLNRYMPCFVSVSISQEIVTSLVPNKLFNRFHS